eukprot:243092-Prorocentrum_lima.AAC.1
MHVSTLARPAGASRWHGCSPLRCGALIDSSSFGPGRGSAASTEVEPFMPEVGGHAAPTLDS